MTRKKALLIGFFFTVIVGTLMHFIYHWTGCSVVVGMFAPVNESVWEHLKMLAIPMLIFGIYEKLTYAKVLSNFWPVRLMSILLGMAILVGGYYLWTAIAGEDNLAADIVDFIVGIGAAYLFSGELLQTEHFSSKFAQNLASVGIAVLFAALFLLTWFPPHCPLFLDPPTGGYGPVK